MKHVARVRILSNALAALALATGSVGCGGDDDGGGDGAADSGPPDATSEPDATACALTECGSECVDTSSDPMHCGECGAACDSPGQICSGSLPCACPEPFLPSMVSPVAFDQVTQQMGISVGLAPILAGEIIDVFLVGFDDTTPIGVAIDLAMTTGFVPFVAAGYDVDPDTQTFHTGYLAVSGRLRLREACSVGVRGVVRNALFVEMDPDTFQPVEGGCEMAVDQLTFDIGDACP